MNTWLIGLAFVLAAGAVMAQAAPAGDGAPDKPFWSSPVMKGESILFVRRPGRPVTGKLLFNASKVLEVRSSSGATLYREGKDYTFAAGSNVITVPAGSAIPVATPKQLTPQLGSQPFDLKRRDGKGDILFGETHQYADMQVVVTYEHDPAEWTLPPPRLATEELPVVLGKLSRGEPVTIVFYGDSITVGGNASKFLNVAPQQPAYPELTVRNLEAAYKSKITMKNLSVGGQTADYGVKNIAKVSAEKPDLVVIAWGMNDSSGTTPRPVLNFTQNVIDQMQAVRKVKPDAEFILVASMLPNADCYWANPQALLEYRDTLRRLAREDVAVADLTSVWEEMLKTKSYLDITGNGVNHPNDFGHRLYADVVSALLIKR